MKCKNMCEPSLCVVLDVQRQVCWLTGDFGMHSYAWGTCLLRMNTELSCPGPSCSYPWCFILSIRDTILSSDARRDAWCYLLRWVTEKRPAVESVSALTKRLRVSRQAIWRNEEQLTRDAENHVASWKVNSLFFLGPSVIYPVLLMNLISV